MGRHKQHEQHQPRYADDGGSEYAIEHLGIKAKNVVSGASNKDYYVPGSLLNVKLASGHPLTLGLPAKEITLLALTLLLSAMTLTGGRATVLQGAVHLVVFAVFLFLAMVP